MLHPKKDGVCRMGEGLSTGVLAAVPSALTSEPQTPVYPHTTVVHSAFPLLNHREYEIVL